MNSKVFDLADNILNEWQDVVDLMAKIIGVPTGLVMRLVDNEIEVLVASHTTGNPYKPGDREHFRDSGLYCERVINSRRRLLVADALSDPDWRDNPDVKLNMISYLGFPLLFPDGTPFGTICVLDNKPNSYSNLYEELVSKMQMIIQNELALLFFNRELGDNNKKLTEYVDEIKVLRQLIPICSNCKKVRDDHGYWEGVESYFVKHLGTIFTHGICPECMRQMYPDYTAQIQKTK